MPYDTWQEALAGLVREKGLQDTELGELSKRASGNGSPSLSGPAGVPGPLTHVSETLDLLQIDAFPTPADLSRVYRGLVSDISLLWSGELEAEFIVTASFDSETASVLLESLSGVDGLKDMDALGYCLTIQRKGPRST